VAAVDADFEKNNISQGSVATRLRFGGIFSDCFTANFLLPTKEFLKSVNSIF